LHQSQDNKGNISLTIQDQFVNTAIISSTFKHLELFDSTLISEDSIFVDLIFKFSQTNYDLINIDIKYFSHKKKPELISKLFTYKNGIFHKQITFMTDDGNFFFST
jgi:hypothetical protein